jgi:prevent-host-death family protein
MKTMPAGEFKARCLKVMDDVQLTREAVVITKKGRPVAKLVPAGSPSDDFLGKLSGVMKIVGDVTQPLDEAEVWDALR